jgi:hypothetical protein
MLYNTNSGVVGNEVIRCKPCNSEELLIRIRGMSLGPLGSWCACVGKQHSLRGSSVGPDLISELAGECWEEGDVVLQLVLHGEDRDIESWKTG